MQNGELIIVSWTAFFFDSQEWGCKYIPASLIPKIKLFPHRSRKYVQCYICCVLEINSDMVNVSFAVSVISTQLASQSPLDKMYLDHQPNIMSSKQPC